MSYTNFPTIKTGGWAFQDPITNDQISQVQEYLLKCPNFVDGGSYAPYSPVVVGDSKITSSGIHVPYRILSDIVTSVTISVPNTTNSYIEVTGCNCAFSNTRVGDVAEGMVMLTADSGNAAGSGSIRVLTKDNVGTNVDSFVRPFVGDVNKIIIPFRSVVTVNGTFGVIAYLGGDGVYTAQAYNFYSAVNHCIYCKLIRPTVE